MVSSLLSGKAGAVKESISGLASPLSSGQLPAVDPLKRTAFEQYYDAAQKNPLTTIQPSPPPPVVETVARNLGNLNLANPQNNPGDIILNNLLGVNTENQTKDHNHLFQQITQSYLSDNPVFILDLQVALANFTVNNLFQHKISGEINAKTKQMIQENS